MTVYHGQPAPGSLLAQLDREPTPRAKRQSPEYAEQSGVVKLYQSIGASVYVNSVYGTQPHGVTPGIPDCRIKHTDWRLEWEHECKAPKGRQSKAQHDYMRECEAMGTVYVLGGVQEALDFLDFLGIVEKRLAGTAQFRRRECWLGRIADAKGAGGRFLGRNWYASGWFAGSLATFGYREPRARRIATSDAG